jgi:hypothetical protein
MPHHPPIFLSAILELFFKSVFVVVSVVLLPSFGFAYIYIYICVFVLGTETLATIVLVFRWLDELPMPPFLFLLWYFIKYTVLFFLCCFPRGSAAKGHTHTYTHTSFVFLFLLSSLFCACSSWSSKNHWFLQISSYRRNPKTELLFLVAVSLYIDKNWDVRRHYGSNLKAKKRN